MNLGHGIDAGTSEEKARFFVDTVQKYRFWWNVCTWAIVVVVVKEQQTESLDAYYIKKKDRKEGAILLLPESFFI